MCKRFKALWMIAVAGCILTVASVAEAAKVRSAAERRQRPNLGFWENSRPSPVSKSFSKSSYPNWNHLFNSGSSTQQKTWGWQHGGRAEFHHPGPRQSNAR